MPDATRIGWVTRESREGQRCPHTKRLLAAMYRQTYPHIPFEPLCTPLEFAVFRDPRAENSNLSCPLGRPERLLAHPIDAGDVLLLDPLRLCPIVHVQAREGCGHGEEDGHFRTGSRWPPVEHELGDPEVNKPVGHS